jgi:hypothetical protein
MRAALNGLPRFIATPGVSKHRIFIWMDPEVLCNQGTLIFARADDFSFGVLHSRIHEIWALEQGTQLETRPRYTPTTSFETFPFPKPTPEQETAISEAARELVEKRDEWLTGEDKKPRHLTRLYNERPTWLDLAHRKLDEAVFAAYGWDPAMTDDALLAALLALNHERAAGLHPQ